MEKRRKGKNGRDCKWDRIRNDIGNRIRKENKKKKEREQKNNEQTILVVISSLSKDLPQEQKRHQSNQFHIERLMVLSRGEGVGRRE